MRLAVGCAIRLDMLRVPTDVSADERSSVRAFLYDFCLRWHLRYGLSCRDVEELLAERGITIDHVTIYRVGAAVHPGVH